MTSRVLRHHDGRWTGVDVRAYDDDPEARFRGVTRQTLLAGGSAGLASETRYFEVEEGGFSRCESHAHAHLVVVLHGEGTVRLDEEEVAIRQFDCVYVAPHSVHQFRAGSRPLGFLCIVDSERDRPRPCPP